MAKYSKGAQKDVESAMNRMEKGTLRSGKSGKKVTNPKQAIAIGLSEAKAKGATVPTKKSASKTVKKAAVTKAAIPAKKAPVKGAVKKTTQKKIEGSGSSSKLTTEKKIKKINSKREAAEKAANEPPVEEKSPSIAVRSAVSILRMDKKLRSKATTKGDPTQHMQLSPTKSPVRPSGKKPLWNR